MKITLQILLLLILLALACLGCQIGQPTSDEVFTEPPIPGVQLWQAAKKSNWLVTFSILGIAAGVFAVVNGLVKLGPACIASSSVSLFMALAVARYAAWMAVFGLIGSAAAALFSILARRQALVEIIRGVQVARNAPPSVTNPVLVEELAKQSKTTKKIVGNMKNELRLAGKI